MTWVRVDGGNYFGLSRSLDGFYLLFGWQPTQNQKGINTTKLRRLRCNEVPSDLDDHYESRRVNFSLRTKSIRTARQSASSVSLKLGGYWQYPL